MRDARRDVEALDLAGKDTEAALSGRFFAAFEEALQAEADAEKRHACLDAVDEGVADVHFIQSAQHLSEVADAGQHDLRGAFEAGGVAHQFVSRADFIERVLHRAQIACAVVEDRDHSRPFVDGSWSLSCSSIEQA